VCAKEALGAALAATPRLQRPALALTEPLDTEPEPTRPEAPPSDGAPVDAPLIDGPLPVLPKAAPLEAGPIDGSPADVPPLDALPCAPAPEEETPRPELDSPPMPVGERALEHPISQALISTRVPIVDVPEKRSWPIVTSLVPFRRLGQADFLLAPAHHLAEGALHRVAPRRRDGAEPRTGALAPLDDCA
jgi:hypothetical protein